MKKITMSVIALFVVVAASSAMYMSQFSTASAVQLKGYDPVSYFVAEAPVRGEPRLSVEHDGFKFHFANAQNRSTFLANPDQYLPAYDGHCSYGVSLGQKFDIDPQSYRIVDGRLFLQLDPGTRTLWMEAENANIQQADKNWPKLQTATN